MELTGATRGDEFPGSSRVTFDINIYNELSTSRNTKGGSGNVE